MDISLNIVTNDSTAETSAKNLVNIAFLINLFT